MPDQYDWIQPGARVHLDHVKKTAVECNDGKTRWIDLQFLEGRAFWFGHTARGPRVGVEIHFGPGATGRAFVDADSVC